MTRPSAARRGVEARRRRRPSASLGDIGAVFRQPTAIAADGTVTPTRLSLTVGAVLFAAADSAGRWRPRIVRRHPALTS